MTWIEKDTQLEMQFPRTLQWLGMESFRLASELFIKESVIESHDSKRVGEVVHLFPGFLRQQGKKRKQSAWIQAGWIADWEWSRAYVISFRNGNKSPEKAEEGPLSFIAQDRPSTKYWKLNSTLQPVLIPDPEVRRFLQCPPLILFYLDTDENLRETAGQAVTSDVLDAFGESSVWSEQGITDFIRDGNYSETESKRIDDEIKRLVQCGILIEAGRLKKDP